MSDGGASRGGQVVVTGASRGIGAAIASVLAGAGRTVVGLSRSGASAVGRGMACDLTDEAALRAAFEAIAAGGPIAALVNNAGMHVSRPAASLDTGRYEEVMRLNATAVMVACREAYPHLKAHGAGRIVNIGSFFDKMGVPGSLAYCASKAAVGAITRCLAVEWAGDGITVVDVAPGYVETDLNRDFLADPKVKRWLARRVPVGRAAQPVEIARVVAALLEADAAYLTGETIYVDGGQGMNH
jgi:NAD(P)-dependent dehydrogenase (short-subunit alcohol dehydrogenase family)